MKRNYKFPVIYEKMNEKGLLDMNRSYVWLNEMEWMPINEVKEYEYEEEELETFLPFAFTGGGDKWVWVLNTEKKEYPVGLCYHDAYEGVYYAKNTEDAIFRQMIEYVSDYNFYINEEEAESYQVSEEELKEQLQQWKESFQGIIKKEYLVEIDRLSQLKLKYIKSDYGEGYTLLSVEEQEAMIEKYIKFDLLEEEFPWSKEL